MDNQKYVDKIKEHLYNAKGQIEYDDLHKQVEISDEFEYYIDKTIRKAQRDVLGKLLPSKYDSNQSSIAVAKVREEINKLKQEGSGNE